MLWFLPLDHVSAKNVNHCGCRAKVIATRRAFRRSFVKEVWTERRETTLTQRVRQKSKDGLIKIMSRSALDAERVQESGIEVRIGSQKISIYCARKIDAPSLWKSLRFHDSQRRTVWRCNRMKGEMPGPERLCGTQDSNQFVLKASRKRQ